MTVGRLVLHVRKLLDAVIAEVSYIDEASGVHIDATRSTQSVVMTVDVKHPTTVGVKHLHDATTLLRPRCQVASTVIHADAAVGTSSRHGAGATATDVMQVTTISSKHLNR